MELSKAEKNRLAEENFNLIYHIANRYHNYSYIKDELVSAGLLGMTNAVNFFDKGRDVKFSTFACACIENEINHYLRKENNPIRRNTVSRALHFYDSESGATYQNVEYSLHNFQSEDNILERIVIQEAYNKVCSAIDELPKDGPGIIKNMLGINMSHPLNQTEQALLMSMSQANVCKKRKRYVNMLKEMCKHVAYAV